MPSSLTPDERRLAFEARRLAIETLVKIHLEQTVGARHLVTSYLRFTFTLSLGALAGVITLYGATLRLTASPDNLRHLDVILGIAALAALVTSALLSAGALQRAATDAAPFVRDPFPNAGHEIDAIFQMSELDENQVLNKLYFAIYTGLEHQPLFKTRAGLSTAFLIVGLLLTGASFLAR